MTDYKPRIGITTNTEERPRKAYAATSKNYVDSVIKAGGIPILIPQFEDMDFAGLYLDTIDGLIITGGDEDVSPMAYGEAPVKEIHRISEKRDRYEFELLKRAMEREMPVLGICRGMQVMNVVNGGSLYQDIFTQKDGVAGHQPKNIPVYNLYHEVILDQEGILYGLFGRDNIKVNSFHHQAVKKLGVNLKVIARSKDGVVEAIQGTADSFLLGVQWHPEDLTAHHEEFIGLFRSLVEASTADIEE